MRSFWNSYIMTKSSLTNHRSLMTVLVVFLGCGSPPEPNDGRAASLPPAPPGTSELWGAAGERWNPAGRLPDFSHAGYHAGETPLPEVAVAVDVRDFGARGDGLQDDSEAFLQALDHVTTGAIFIPPGRYKITRVLELRKSGVVLRGAGRDVTVLFFPLPLVEVLGKGRDGGPHGWSWSGGWIWAKGGIEPTPTLATVVAPAARGDRVLELSTTSGIRPGQRVHLRETENDGSLTLHLHAGQPLFGRCAVDRPGMVLIDWSVQVERIEGRKVILDRPLRVDVRLEWRPEIRLYQPQLTEIGVEHLTIEFPETDYAGHHREPGYNGIFFESVDNSWVRDVAVINFDSALHFWYSRYSTAQDLLLTGRGGHYGINLGGTQDCLATRFNIKNVSQHDLSTSNLGNGSVFSRGQGEDVNFDHHRGAAYDNLFSDIHVGRSWNTRRLWKCSETKSGHYTAARETFWNVRPRVSGRWLPLWPQLNVIGRMGKTPPNVARLIDAWVEPVANLTPRDLHSAQLAHRLGRLTPAQP